MIVDARKFTKNKTNIFITGTKQLEIRIDRWVFLFELVSLPLA